MRLMHIREERRGERREWEGSFIVWSSRVVGEDEAASTMTTVREPGGWCPESQVNKKFQGRQMITWVKCQW